MVFTDEKPMKEVMIYYKTRRDIEDGTVPENMVPSTAKNRYNILCAVNINITKNSPIDYVIIEATTDSAIFTHFVKRLIENGTLQQGDYFILDNCTVHTQGDNIGLKQALWDQHNVWLILLPPYSPELNPTELVFRTLVMRLLAENRRYNCLDANDFVDAIDKTLGQIGLAEIASYYHDCTYL